MSLPSVLRDKLRLPAIGAPLFIISHPALVIAQCKAGIVGAFPALNARPISQLDEWLHEITEALAAHATQVVVGPTRRVCALSNNVALPIVGQEHYVLAAGSAGERDERGWETDLLAGLGLDG